jgi:hypothetical protein
MTLDSPLLLGSFLPLRWLLQSWIGLDRWVALLGLRLCDLVVSHWSLSLQPEDEVNSECGSANRCEHQGKL